MSLSRSQVLDALVKDYERAISEPIHDDPARYCLVLNLITDEIERINGLPD